MKIKKQNLHKIASALIALFIAILCIFVLPEFTFIKKFELRLLDERFALRKPIPQSDNIVHIDIDDSSIDQIGRWPWSRAVHASVVDALKELGARLIIFDVEFPQSENQSEDVQLAESSQNANIVIFPFSGTLKKGNLSDEKFSKLYNACKKYFEEDILISRYELAQKISVDEQTMDNYFMSLLSTFIEEKVRPLIEEDKNIGISAVIRSLKTNIKAQAEKTIGFEGFPDFILKNIYRIYQREKSLKTLKDSFSMQISKKGFSNFSFLDISPPIPELAESSAGLGFVSIEPDIDGTFRKIIPVIEFNDNFYFSLALITISRFLNLNLSKDFIFEKDKIKIPSKGITIPLDEEGKIILNWAGSRGSKWEEYFTHIPYAKIRELATTKEKVKNLENMISNSTEEEKKVYELAYQKELNNQKSLIEKLTPYIKDKICFIGASHTSSYDLKPSPIAVNLPGVAVHSTLVNSILQNKFITPKSRTTSNILGFVLSLICIIITALAGPLVATIFVSVTIFSWVLFNFIAFSHYDQYYELLVPTLTIFLPFIPQMAYKHAFELKEQRFLKSVFKNMTSKEYLDKILDSFEEIKLGGDEIYATVYFSDLENFTPLSEQVKPTQLVSVLNEYFSIMADTIMSHSGYIDKYVGDGVMAIFGLVKSGENNHPKDACISAIRNIELVDIMKSELVLPQMIRMRVGIATGKMIAGHFGMRKKMQYTVLGDIVNVAARLEPLNKIYRTSILVNEDTYNEAKDYVEFREVDSVRLKGKEKPITIFEVISVRGELPEDKKKYYELYASALNEYKSRNWDNAKNIFQQCFNKNPNDDVVRIYLQRCEHFSIFPPPDDWDGVFETFVK